MKTVVVNKCEELLEHSKGESVYIYGAKTIAQKVRMFLEKNSIVVDSFVVSEKYVNPTIINTKKVIHIEDYKDTKFNCMVVAVGHAFLWDVVDELQEYNIDKLIVVSPIMENKFPSISLSVKCNISNRAFISEYSRIYVDESSELIIKDNVFIEEECIITVLNHSRLVIDEKAVLKNGTILLVLNQSEGLLSENTWVGEGNYIQISDDSRFYFGKKSAIDSCGEVIENNHSVIEIADNCRIGRYAFLCISERANIRIGIKTTVGRNVYMTCEKSEIVLGSDAMLSTYIKIAVGNHCILKEETEITNYQPIVAEEHVWIGTGATLLSGAFLGKGVIVGASSVVTGKIPAQCVGVGTPMRVVNENVLWHR